LEHVAKGIGSFFNSYNIFFNSCIMPFSTASGCTIFAERNKPKNETDYEKDLPNVGRINGFICL
jgi:hypothetical protein